jgi:hypothetical protein
MVGPFSTPASAAPPPRSFFNAAFSSALGPLQLSPAPPLAATAAAAPASLAQLSPTPLRPLTTPTAQTGGAPNSGWGGASGHTSNATIASSSSADSAPTAVVTPPYPTADSEYALTNNYLALKTRLREEWNRIDTDSTDRLNRAQFTTLAKKFIFVSDGGAPLMGASAAFDDDGVRYVAVARVRFPGR